MPAHPPPLDYARASRRPSLRSLLRVAVGLHLLVLPFLLVSLYATNVALRPSPDQLRFGRRGSTDVRLVGQLDHLEIRIATISGPNRHGFSYHAKDAKLDELYWTHGRRMSIDPPQAGRHGWDTTATTMTRYQFVSHLARGPADFATHRSIRIPASELVAAFALSGTLFILLFFRHYRRVVAHGTNRGPVQK
jgi:hypothetical protein